MMVLQIIVYYKYVVGQSSTLNTISNISTIHTKCNLDILKGLSI